MKQDKTSEGYISNKYLRELVVKFNSMNINDNGKWCDAYEKKMDKKNAKGNMKIDKYEVSKSFIHRKKQQIAALHTRYENFSDEERRAFDAEFEKVKKDICEAFLKVIDGRIISYKLVQTPAYEEIDDIRQEALMSLFTYINRYDETRNTSAFAFVTELISNAMNGYLKKMNQRNAVQITGLDFYENLNTIDDMYGEDND
jgi:Sigma-70 region 2.